MRTLFLFTCLANIALAVALLWLLPDPAAVHFGADGAANGFGSPRELVPMFIGFIVIMAGTLLGVGYLPASLVNVPNKDYWFNDENRTASMKKIRGFLDELGFGIMAFFLLLQWQIVQANRLDPPRLPPNVMGAATVVLSIFLLAVTIRILLAFRLPKNTETPI